MTTSRLVLFGKAAIFFFIGIFCLQFALAAANPTATAPNNIGVPDVVHVGATPQTKAGTFQAASLGTNALGANLKGYKLGSDSGWVMLNNIPTVVAERFCLGTYPTGFNVNNCITNFTSGAAGSGYELQYRTRIIPIAQGNEPHTRDPYHDYCQATITTTDINSGWTSSGSDVCSQSGIQNCNPYHEPIKCTDVRLVKSDASKTPVAPVIVYPTVSETQAGCTGGTPFFGAPWWNATCQPECVSKSDDIEIMCSQSHTDCVIPPNRCKYFESPGGHEKF